MKLGVEEWIRKGEFFLYIDTHDEMELPREDPDYSAWQELRRFNAALKAEIERAWHEAGLPTLYDTRFLCPVNPSEKTAIIGENSGYEAETLAALLNEEGYRPLLTSDADVLLRQARKTHPDLIVLNSFVGEVPGHIIADTLRRSAETSSIPIVLVMSPFDVQERASSASAVITRPVTIESLRKALAVTRR
ncbi:MAG TPA: response regulator [Planctomycetes bacterium]|nr:response regulator [Planctomycetota bacterium]